MYQQELNERIRKHALWLQDVEGGERLDLSYVDLSGANFSGADLSSTNFSGADLSGANLSYANLRGANLSGAKLSYADLRDARLWNTTGNNREIKTIQAGNWPVVYTATHMQIGCQNHAIGEWWSFSDEEIDAMDSDALTWWADWKPLLQRILEVSPATPTGAEQ